MNKFIEHLRSGLLLGDGAIGTLLYQRGFGGGGCYEALNLEQPEAVTLVHRDYLAAGARLIETNTYGANRARLERFGLSDRVAEINRRGAELAVAAARPVGAFVAGSIGPCSNNSTETHDREKQAALFREQIEPLIAGGVDALFFESFQKVGDLVLAVSTARKLTALPIIASLSFGDDGHTADGLRINEAFAQLRTAGADVTGLNCHTGPAGAESLLRELTVREGALISVYPNAGRPEYVDGRYFYHAVPGYFATFVPKLAAQGARLIGGCCGTTPETIAAMAVAMSGLKSVETKAGIRSVIRETSVPKPSSRPPAASAESLLELIQRKKVIVTELDPPKSLSLDKLVEGAKALKHAGTDFVTLADNSLAILRVSNMAAGFRVKAETGTEPIIHLACRDRNLLGLQSELMGFHELGIHHVLALTGDPSKVGDHPGSTSVYDVNSVGLIKTIKRLNEGFAANGRDLKGQTRFTIGCAFNPNARNVDSQVRKLEDKVRAGAQFAMTQPIFNPDLARLTFEKTKHLGIPVFVGVMPLLNARNTEFLHNEVPGIVIPDEIREKMRGREGTDGNSIGLQFARELCDAILEHFAGIYLITPLMRFDLTVELSSHVRRQTDK